MTPTSGALRDKPEAPASALVTELPVIDGGCRPRHHLCDLAPVRRCDGDHELDMLDLAISSRLENESEPVVTRPNMGTLLAGAHSNSNQPEALRTPKPKIWRGWRGNTPHAGLVPPWEKFFDSVVDLDVITRTHPFSRRGVAYEVAALAIATRQPISELQNADPRSFGH